MYNKRGLIMDMNYIFYLVSQRDCMLMQDVVKGISYRWHMQLQDSMISQLLENFKNPHKYF